MTHSTQARETVLIDPFRAWCAKLNPVVYKDKELFSQRLIAPPSKLNPNGSFTRDEAWIFPIEWFPSGPNRLSFAFDVPEESLTSNTRLMLRQYAVALMCQRPARAMVSIRNKVELCRRLIERLVAEGLGGSSLSAASLTQLNAASSALASGWAPDNSDRLLLNSVIADIADFRKDNWLSDGFCDVSLDKPLTGLPIIERQKYFDEIKKTSRVEGTIAAPSQRGVQPLKGYVEAMLPIAIFLIEDLSPFVIENALLLADIKEQVSKEKSKKKVCKKVLGRTIAGQYRQKAHELASCRETYARACRQYERLTGATFSVATFRDLFAQIANVQMACYQVTAFLSAARKGEMHGLHPDGIGQTTEGVVQLHGRIRKGAGPIGYRSHSWIVDGLVEQAISVQWSLFEPFRQGEDHLWCQTAPQAIGTMMRDSESLHLEMFADRNNLRHLLDEAGISPTVFRKTWAKIMYLSGMRVMSIARQFGHSAKEVGEASVTMNYVNRDPFTRAEKRLQTNSSAYRLPAGIARHGKKLLNDQD